MNATVKNILKFISDNWHNGIKEKFCNNNPYFGIYKEDSNTITEVIYTGNDYTFYPDFDSMLLYVENNVTGKVKKFKINLNK